MVENGLAGACFGLGGLGSLFLSQFCEAGQELPSGEAVDSGPFLRRAARLDSFHDRLAASGCIADVEDSRKTRLQALFDVLLELMLRSGRRRNLASDD